MIVSRFTDNGLWSVILVLAWSMFMYHYCSSTFLHHYCHSGTSHCLAYSRVSSKTPGMWVFSATTSACGHVTHNSPRSHVWTSSLGAIIQPKLNFFFSRQSTSASIFVHMKMNMKNPKHLFFSQHGKLSTQWTVFQKKAWFESYGWFFNWYFPKLQITPKFGRNEIQHHIWWFWFRHQRFNWWYIYTNRGLNIPCGFWRGWVQNRCYAKSPVSFSLCTSRLKKTPFVYTRLTKIGMRIFVCCSCLLICKVNSPI